MTEIALIQVFFFTAGSKQKNIKETHKTIAPSYHSKVSSTHFSLVWVMEFSIVSSCKCKVNVFSNNSNLPIIGDVQCLHDTDSEFYVFLTGLNGCNFGVDSHCSYLNFRYGPVSGNELLDIQATTECRFTLKRVYDNDKNTQSKNFLLLPTILLKISIYKQS